MIRNKYIIHQKSMVEKNNPITALNILYTKEKEILPAYIQK